MNNTLIVVPCLNEEDHLERLVHRVVGNTQKLPVRVAIVDGGSHDRSVDIARHLAARLDNVLYLHNPKRIQSSALNLAVQTFGANDDYVIRLDAHAEYPENYCVKLLEEAAATDAASVAVAMETTGGNGFQAAVAAAQNARLGHGGSPHRSESDDGHWVDHGHHALMRLDAFRAIGGYDETFSHNEDAELDIRLVKAGYKIWLTRKTYLTYFPRATPWALFKQYMGFGAGRARTYLKHREPLKVRQLLPVAVAPIVLLVLLSPFVSITIYPFLIWAAFCLGYGFLLGLNEARTDIALMSGTAAMIMHFGWSLGFWKEVLLNLNKLRSTRS